LVCAQITALQPDEVLFKKHGKILLLAIEERFCNGEEITFLAPPSSCKSFKTFWKLWGLLGWMKFYLRSTEKFCFWRLRNASATVRRSHFLHHQLAVKVSRLFGNCGVCLDEAKEKGRIGPSKGASAHFISTLCLVIRTTTWIPAHSTDRCKHGCTPILSVI
jgi:hypothetical protein